MIFSTITPPSRSMISTRSSVVVVVSFASQRASFGFWTAPLVNWATFFVTTGVSTISSTATGAILQTWAPYEREIDLVTKRFLCVFNVEEPKVIKKLPDRTNDCINEEEADSTAL